MDVYLIKILVFIFLIIASLFFATNEALTESPRYFRQILMFLLVSIVFTSILLGCIFYIGSKKAEFEILYISLILCGVALLLGFLYIWTFDGNLKWVDKLPLSNKIWFTLAISLLGQLLILVISRIFYKSSVPDNLWTGGLFYPVPFLMREAFRAWNEIPEPLYKIWTIPNKRPNIREYDPNSIQRPKLMILANTVEPLGPYTPKLPTKAPFGEIFHAFILQLNEDRMLKKLPTINLGNELGAGTQWHFYIKAEGFFNQLFYGNRYIDPDKTCEELGLSEKRIIARQIN
ncbi:TssN family type VI secretion system protein [Emticicia sp. 17c]|uniref:TssN family type VI secretion system protein n=1 Tax=Emticicia sp. 17c TaxID=3127704 RepID=UPI00301BE5B1